MLGQARNGRISKTSALGPRCPRGRCGDRSPNLRPDLAALMCDSLGPKHVIDRAPCGPWRAAAMSNFAAVQAGMVFAIRRFRKKVRHLAWAFTAISETCCQIRRKAELVDGSAWTLGAAIPLLPVTLSAYQAEPAYPDDILADRCWPDDAPQDHVGCPDRGERECRRDRRSCSPRRSDFWKRPRAD
jgi:hypothetical protein